VFRLRAPYAANTAATTGLAGVSFRHFSLCLPQVKKTAAVFEKRAILLALWLF
jgi:hypothetical protein